MQGIANNRCIIAKPKNFLKLHNKSRVSENILFYFDLIESGRQDSNLRSSAPKAQECTPYSFLHRYAYVALNIPTEKGIYRSPNQIAKSWCMT